MGRNQQRRATAVGRLLDDARKGGFERIRAAGTAYFVLHAARVGSYLITEAAARLAARVVADAPSSKTARALRRRGCVF